MDTILYFYELKENIPKAWLIQRYPFEEYLLLRIGIPPYTLQALSIGMYEAFRSLAENIKGIIRSGSRCNAWFEPSVEHLSNLWEQFFPFPCLRPEELSRDPWVEILMTNAEKKTTLPADYVLYGFSEGIYGSLWSRTRKIRRITIIPLKQPTGALAEDYLEELEWEQGILTDINPNPSPQMPVTVLDFGRQEKSHVRMPGGSVWLDFYPIPAKKRYICDRMGQVNYFSMPGQWKSP